MRGRAAFIPFVVVLVVVCAATVGFAASGGEPGRPDQPGKSEAQPANQDSSNHDPSNPDGTYRGKSSSTPDQDGIGADHGVDNNDKTGAGTDGNNGCGNDADREDDNNGWCGKPPGAGPEPSVSPTATATATVGTEVLGRKVTRPRTEVAGRELARTGAPLTNMFFAAIALLLLGASLRVIAYAKG